MTPVRKEPNMETYSGRFAARLRELREKANLSQAEAAESIGVSQNTVSRWETGDRQPNLEQFPKIAEAYRLKRPKDLLP